MTAVQLSNLMHPPTVKVKALFGMGWISIAPRRPRAAAAGRDGRSDGPS